MKIASFYVALALLSTHIGLSFDNSYFFSINSDNLLIGYGLYVPNPSCEVVQESAWNIFHNSVFELPIALEIAQQNNLPFVLIIPSNYKNKSTIDCNAPVIE